MLTNDDISKLKEWNNTNCAYESNLCIHNKLEFQASQNPNEIAVRFLSNNLTYRELDESSNAFANLLIEKGVKTESFVLVYLERSLEMMIAIFGTLKSGGVYTPVNSAFPAHRISDIIADSDPAVIVTSKDLEAKLPSTHIPIILVDDFLKNIQKYDNSKPQVIVKPENLAYAIFTSGSTGKPKGVLIEHHSVMNRIGWMQKEYPISKTDILLQKTPITFDVSIWELFWWSFVGASLAILPPNHEKSPQKIIDTIENNHVSVIHFVPSMFNVFVNYLDESYPNNSIKSLRWVFCSGEELNYKTVTRYYEINDKLLNNSTVINLYGPTEATVDVTYFTCPKNFETNIPIGKPIDNTQIYILDDNNGILPPNSPGELVICGVNLARGYLNRGTLNTEKFIKINVFDSIIRAYKTGDLAYFNNDGNIIYQGRIDRQVKLRGYRIELPEIENVLLGLDGIQECYCLVLNEKEENAQIACFYKSNKQNIIGKTIKTYLEKKLPSYMIPGTYQSVTEFPLSVNGKLDKIALINLINIKESTDNVVPMSHYEKKIHAMWALLFNKKSIDPNINFFDLGGNSLMMVQLTILMKKEFNKDFDVFIILQNPTIRLLAKYLHETN